MSVFGARVQQEHNGPTLVVNDVELLAPAAGLDDAIAVIAGTGSKVVGHGPDGAVISAGGHGFLIDDEGSAPWIAREAVSAVLEADDQGREPDVLARMLMDHFDVVGVVEAGHAFASMVGLTNWARLCPLVFDAADRGSAVAASVITAAAAALAHDVALVHRRGAIGNDVLCAGGVITNQPRLYDELVREIGTINASLSVSLLTVAPVMGALALARKLCNKTTAK
jgi:glucosamine kinase